MSYPMEFTGSHNARVMEGVMEQDIVRAVWSISRTMENYSRLKAFLDALIYDRYGVAIKEECIDYLNPGGYKREGFQVCGWRGNLPEKMFHHRDYLSCLEWVFKNCELMPLETEEG